MDRLVAAYEDLATKRFRVLADFETPEQGSLFRMEPPAGSGSVAMTTERSKPETGVGSLKMALVNSSQRVVGADSPGGGWALYRDWSRYHMLLFSVFSPRPLGGFCVGITSGLETRLDYSARQIMLNQGWNTIRLDLGEMGDSINLGDVREVRCWCEPLDTPIDLYLDDLILVDNSRLLFGPEVRVAGDLYVREQGRQLVVGATERFELVFSRGVIRQWFDLAHDPDRVHNLAAPGALGPVPVVLPQDPSAAVSLQNADAWQPLGRSVENQQGIVEATPLRVLLRGVRRFGSPDQPPTQSSPYQQWTYSVYADGRVYLECSGTARAPGFDPAGIGIAFACDPSLGFDRHLVSSRPADAADQPVGFALFGRSGSGASDLLIVPSQTLPVRPVEATSRSAAALWQLQPAGDLYAFAALVRLWPADVDTPGQASPVAIDYRNPLPLAVDIGNLVRTDPGDLDGDGFSEARGYYVLQLDGNVAKIRIDGRSRARFSPVFRVVGVSERDVWAYQDGRQIRMLVRDAEGNVLLQLPGLITTETLLEITARKRGTS